MKKLVLAVALVTLSVSLASKVYAAQTGVKMEFNDDDKSEEEENKKNSRKYSK